MKKTVNKADMVCFAANDFYKLRSLVFDDQKGFCKEVLGMDILTNIAPPGMAIHFKAIKDAVAFRELAEEQKIRVW